MHIIWRGQACFEIVAFKQKGEQVSICIDPFSDDIGIKMPSFSADLLLVTHPHFDHNNKKAIKGDPFTIEGPGEYEARGVFVKGIPAWHDNSQGLERGENTIYVIETEELRVCHLGDLGQKELSSEQIGEMGDIDVLLIPVGGIYTINGAEATKIIAQIEPRMVIPMHYGIGKLRVKLDGVDKFLAAMGVKSMEQQPKLLIKKKDLPQEETKVVILKP